LPKHQTADLGPAGLGIGLVSGFARVGGGILTNIILALSELPMHKSIGRAAAVGVVVSVPATIVAAFGPTAQQAGDLGSIHLSIWACIAPAQAVAPCFGAQFAQRIAGDSLSRIFAAALGIARSLSFHCRASSRNVMAVPSVAPIRPIDHHSRRRLGTDSAYPDIFSRLGERGELLGSASHPLPSAAAPLFSHSYPLNLYLTFKTCLACRPISPVG
jgi:hypothetical protein